MVYVVTSNRWWHFFRNQCTVANMTENCLFRLRQSSKRRHFETRRFRHENGIICHFHKNKSFSRHFNEKFLLNKNSQFLIKIQNFSSLKNAVFSKLCGSSHHHSLPKIPFFLKNMVQNLIEITG